MTEVSGAALSMKLKLARLCKHHGVAPLRPIDVPLYPPADGDVIVEGLASTPRVDLTRTSITAEALRWTGDVADIPLLANHDSGRVVGTILALRHTEAGLWVKAHVTDPEAARMGAFSIGGRIDAFAVRNETSRDFYAEVTAGTLLEVSLTSAPACPGALVTKRYPLPRDMQMFEDYRKTMRARYDLAERGVRLVQEGLRTLAGRRPSRTADLMRCEATAGVIYGAVPLLRRRSEFSRLIDQLEARP